MSEHDDDLEVATSVPQNAAEQIADAVATGLGRIAAALERGLHEIAAALATVPAPRPRASRPAAARRRTGARKKRR